MSGILRRVASATDEGTPPARGDNAIRLQRARDEVERRQTGNAPPSGPAAWASGAADQRITAAGPQRSVARPDTSERAVRQAELWNRALRRELTVPEWSQLSQPQQSQVRFNSELLKAYDLDVTESPTERRNTKALYSNLALDDTATADVNAKLGIGVGPATRYSDLFDSSGVKSDGGNAQLAGMSEKIAAYIAELQGSGGDAVTTSATERAAQLPSQYTFATDVARSDYETSFNALLDPATLTVNDWATIQKNLVASGYKPEDFKTYILDRMKLLPVVEGQSTLTDIQSWFG